MLIMFIIIDESNLGKTSILYKFIDDKFFYNYYKNLNKK